MHCTGFIKESQEILKFGIPFWSGNALIALLTLPIMGEIGRIAGVGALGQFRIAQSLSQVVSFLPGAIAPVVVSILSESYKPNENTNDFEKLRSLHMRGNWLLALTLVMFLSLNSNLIINMLYGKAYIDAVPLVIGMGWLSFMVVIADNLNLYTLSAGNTLTIAIASISQKAIVIGFSFWLIPIHKTMGYIIAMISGVCIQLVIMAIYTWKKISRILQQQSIKLFVWSITIFAMTSLSQLFQLATSRNLLLSGGITIIFFMLILFTTFELAEIKKFSIKLKSIYSSRGVR
jgi:O-antigen/teichoic acid export membrane protein